MSDSVEQKVFSFFSQYKNQTYRKGEILVRADDQPMGVFYLVSGNIKVYSISNKGDELVVNFFKPKTFFPMSWAINNTTNNYFYEAVSDTKVIRCPKENVIEFIKANPDVLYDLLSRVYIGTDGLLTKITYLMSGKASSRLITELIILAKRFGKKTTSGIEIQISEKDIAAQTGMTRETISRELKILKNKNLVLIERNKVVILDIDVFQDELTEGF